ncbi:MAG: VOC family protein [Pseudomonadota bacterium]
MSQVVKALGTFGFDHVALGVSDTEAGAAWLHARTGAAVFATEPEEGQWYWSAVMPLPDGASLEVIGPNPAHRGFHPIKEHLLSLETPSLLFWHLGTDHFDSFCNVAAQVGAPVERIEHLDTESPYGRRVYTRGIVGPGFRSTRPCVICWKTRPRPPGAEGPAQCAVTGFALTSPKYSALNRLLDALDLPMRAKEGPEAIALQLTTPKGAVTLSSPGIVFEGAGALAKTASLWLRYLGRTILRKRHPG